MEIKVVGTGCASCKKLEESVRAVVAENNIEAEITKISDIMEIAKSGILITPGLIIDGKIKLSGKLPEKSEVEKIILEAKNN
jgi:small redox-active disulfide protein 2